MGLFDIFRRKGRGAVADPAGRGPASAREPLVVDALAAPTPEADTAGRAGETAGAGTAPGGTGGVDGAGAAGAPPDGPVDRDAIEKGVVEALWGVYDPEIPVNIYELGLIYDIRVSPEAVVDVRMTLTAPNCPAAGILPGEVEATARRVPGVRDVRLDLTFDPPWNPDMMSDAAKLELGML